MSGYTQTQLDALKAAYARGVKSVSYDGQTVQFNSPEEMWTKIQRIERALSGKARSRTSYPEFSRGT